MFGHRDSVIVLRVMVLLQSMELRVPTKCVPEKLKQRDGGELRDGCDLWLRAIDKWQGERIY